MTIDIQYAKISELKEVNDLFVSILSKLTYYNDLAKLNEIKKYSESELAIKLKDDPKSILVAKNDYKIVGFCFSRFDDFTIWLEWFGVSEDIRNNQIGFEILKKLEISTLERNCHKIWCDTRTDNTISAKVLRRKGFENVATLNNHWYNQDFYIWQKLL
jgi:RimJ/RimL family protein N-acetyltransferase